MCSKTKASACSLQILQHFSITRPLYLNSPEIITLASFPSPSPTPKQEKVQSLALTITTDSELLYISIANMYLKITLQLNTELNIIHFINKLGLWIFTGRSLLRKRRYINTGEFTEEVSALEVESHGEYHCTGVTWLVIAFKL